MTLLGMTIEVNAHCWKALTPITVRLCDRSTEVKAEHPEKASSPMLVTLFAMVNGDVLLETVYDLADHHVPVGWAAAFVASYVFFLMYVSLNALLGGSVQCMLKGL